MQVARVEASNYYRERVLNLQIQSNHAASDLLSHEYFLMGLGGHRSGGIRPDPQVSLFLVVRPANPINGIRDRFNAGIAHALQRNRELLTVYVQTGEYGNFAILYSTS
jgi:hypothetical protein